ncbi:MAG: TRAP transporter small permease [Armatimonadota bacterium]|nr:TRAP transporter small permease [Armatimonadota bacterium]MDR5688851.1 TRAP transporter small permease [Armatimonadota bacterium]MDR7385852.1 TRAP transporter small permease [Armatimonadota bacterium]MDR7388622.1 TRAP transporter small permease [Armatimonadota bacterium]MDR7390777.1 TRAP transporter small permease [Armatimonadota bacterium]
MSRNGRAGVPGRWLDVFEEAGLVLLFVAMFGIAFANVITRYFLRYALAFTEEIVLAAFVWATLLGASVAFRRGAHLAFTFVVDHLPRRGRRAALWVSTAATGVLCVALAYYGVQQVRLEQQLGSTTEALALPQWWYTLGVPVLAVVMVLRALQAALHVDRSLRG